MTVLGLNDQPFDSPEEEDSVLKPSNLTELIMGVGLDSRFPGGLGSHRWVCCGIYACENIGNSPISKPSTGLMVAASRMVVRTLVPSGISASTST